MGERECAKRMWKTKRDTMEGIATSGKNSFSLENGELLNYFCQMSFMFIYCVTAALHWLQTNFPDDNCE